MPQLQTTHEFHPIYRAWFLWVDPVLTLAGMYGNLIDHDTNVTSFFTDLRPSVHLVPYFYQIGGMGASYLVLSVFLLRYTEDVGVWKILQAAITCADFTLLAATYVGMRHEGTLSDVSAWRFLDWANIVITGICTVLRIAFVLGIGIKAKKAVVTGRKAA